MDAPPVLLIHGFASDHRLTWERAGWLSQLDRTGRRWIAPDLIGHGTSDKPHDPDAYSVPFVLERLLNGVEDSPIDVVGYSLGAELALELAAADPQRVRRVVAGGVGPRRLLAAEDAEAIWAHAAEGRPLPKGLATTLWSIMNATPNNDLEALAACLVGISRMPRSASPVTAATLLFAGSADELADGIDELESQLPRAELVRIDGRNHLTTLSASRLKQRAVAFLND